MSKQALIPATILTLSSLAGTPGFAAQSGTDAVTPPAKEISPVGKVPYQNDSWTDTQSIQGDRSLVLEMQKVPPGSRLVVQQVSVVAETDDSAIDVSCFVYAGTQDNRITQVSPSHPLMLGPQSRIASPAHTRIAARVASQPLTLYVESGLVPEINCRFSDPLQGHAAAISGTVTGYLIGE